MIDLLHQKPLLGRQINWAHPLARGLVAYWVFNEGSGNKVYDIASHRYDLDFINAPTWVAGRNGYALNFVEGSSQYLTRSTTLLHPLTLACWFIADNTNSDHQLMAVGDSSVDFAFDSLHIESNDNKLWAYTWDGTPAGAISAGNVTTGVLHHGCAVFPDHLSRTVYLDGTDTDTDNTAQIDRDANYDVFRIGATADSVIFKFPSTNIVEYSLSIEPVSVIVVPDLIIILFEGGKVTFLTKFF